MKRIVIFDFNRTIYDPDSKRLIENVEDVLRALIKRGFVLYLVSRGDNERKELINQFSIARYFARIIVTKEKDKKDFEKLVADKSILRQSSFVVGDRVKQEITFGNLLGLQTIWVRNGKFSNELPQSYNEKPRYIVFSIKEILKIIH